MFKSKTKTLLLFCSLGVITLGCNLEYFGEAVLEDFEWNPSIALPIGEISYSVSELFEDLDSAGVDISPNSDDIVTITYEEELKAQNANAFVSMVNQSLNEKRSPGINVSNPGVASQVSINDVFAFDWQTSFEEVYDSINFSDGSIQLMISSDIDADITYSLTIQSLLKKPDRTPLTLSGTLSTQNPSFTFNDELKTYLADLTQDVNGDATNNSVVVNLDYEINIAPNSSIQETDGIEVSLTFGQPQFDAAYVFLGQRPIDVSFDLLNLDFFDTFGEGTIDFAEPVFKFTFDNSFGFPLGIRFNEMAAVTQIGEIINLSGDIVNRVNVVEGPQLADSGSSIETTIAISANNSNLPDLVNSKPSKVIVDVTAFANPVEAPFQYNYLINSSQLRIKGVLEMPMIVNINQLTSTQRVDLNISSTLEQANRLLLRIITENELPLGGNIELSFVDAGGDILLVKEEVAFFNAAAVGPDGRTTGAVSQTVDITLTNEEIRLMESSVGIDVKMRLNTTNSNSGMSVKFFSDYQLKIKLAAQADVIITNSN
ncbi:MAG: hypothetical protein ACJAS3_000507 [Roseivirga sp.]|jgi:hypothetical protein